MPRRRMVDPQIWRNEKVGSLPDAGRLLFIGIFSQADDDGRLNASPRFLMANIFPYDKDKTEEDIRHLRDQCAGLGLIRVYTNGKKEYLDIPGWSEHQQIRKDRYSPSSLPSFEEADNQPTAIGQPSSNQATTIEHPNIVKSSLVKSSTPSGAQRALKKETQKKTDPQVTQILAEMRAYLGYPEKTDKDPIPAYGREGQAIKRMLTRGFTRKEVTDCWKQKVDVRGGEFVSMTWVNEDIGKIRGEHGKPKKRSQGLPEKYTPPDEYRERYRGKDE
jgi:hypothetical protein